MIQKTVYILLVFTFCASFASAHSPCPPGEYSSYDDCFGKYQWDSGDIYVGDWENGKRTGQGTYTTSKGTRYVGTFKDNKKHGQETFIYVNGAKEVGEWKNHKLDGYVIKYNADGTIFREGIFKDDKFLREEKRTKSTSSASRTSKLNEYKEFCKEIGFTLGTEKFGDCVIKLMDRD